MSLKYEPTQEDEEAEETAKDDGFVEISDVAPGVIYGEVCPTRLEHTHESRLLAHEAF